MCVSETAHTHAQMASLGHVMSLCEESDLLQLQTMAPGSLQQVTQAVDECVLLQAGDAGFPLSQFHALFPHPLHQHSFGLRGQDTVLRGFDFD